MGITHAGTAAVAAMARPASPIVLVGGVFARASGWDDWVRELAAAGVPHAVAATPKAGLAGRQSYVDAIHGARELALRRANLPADTPVSIVGFSAGGVGAVEYLHRFPQLVDRVVAMASPLRGNWLATACTEALRGATPKWIRDLAAGRSVARDIDPNLAGRVTSIVGAPIDGIVTRRSGVAEGINVVLADEQRFHAAMQSDASMRHAALRALT